MLFKRLLFLFVAAAVIAAFSARHSRAESLLLDEIEVKGKMESPREESLSVREVRESPARDIGEALKQVEGMTCVRKGAIANDVVLRGMQGDNINVLIDGVKLYGACPNRMDSPEFHMDFAEVSEIKVVKGPYDVANAGSMGGLVDVKTKPVPMRANAEASVTAGSWGSVNASALGSYGTDAADGMLGYAYKYSRVPRSGDGRRITEIYRQTDANRYRTGDLDTTAYQINTAWTKFGYNISEKTRAQVNYSYQDARHVIYPFLLMDGVYDKTHRLNLEMTSKEPVPWLDELKAQIYYDRVDHLMDNRLRVAAQSAGKEFTMQTDADASVIGGRLEGVIQAGPGMLRPGVDYYRRNWDAINQMLMMGSFVTQRMIPDVDVDNIGLFMEYRVPLTGRLKLSAGVRGDFTTVDAGTLTPARIASLFQQYFPGQDLKTRVEFAEAGGNLQLTFSPAEQVELFLGLARGVRTPDPQELYVNLRRGANPPRVGNPGLSPSKEHEVDLGVNYFTDRFYVNATAFVSFVDDYINITDKPSSTPGQPAARTYENVHARFFGVEAGSQFSLPWNMFLKGSLSYVEAQNTTGDRPISEIPPFRGSMALRYDTGVYFAELAENLAARQGRVDSNLTETPTGGWATTDIRGGFGYRGLTVIAGINNLFDKYYLSHLSYQRDPFQSGVKVPENGRNFYVTVMYRI